MLDELLHAAKQHFKICPCFWNYENQLRSFCIIFHFVLILYFLHSLGEENKGLARNEKIIKKQEFGFHNSKNMDKF